ncbi:hypothetical protein ACFL1A_00030 [Patescibacteria group bacterium]
MFGICLIPFMYSISSQSGFSSTTGTLLFTSNAVKAPLEEFRSYITNFSPLLAKTFFNMPLALSWQYLKNIISYINIDFLFLTGSAHGNHGIQTAGQFYMFELFTILIGLCLIIRTYKKPSWIIIGWIFITILVASLTRESPHATRSLFMSSPLILLSSAGTLYTFYLIQKQQKFIRLILSTIVTFVISYSLIIYFSSYYLRFPIYYASAWKSADYELSKFLQNQETKYDKIIIDNNSGFIYTSFLFYTAYPPEIFQSTQKRAPDDNEGFSEILSFGNLEIRTPDPDIDSSGTKNLIVSASEINHPNLNNVITIYYPKKPVVLSIKEQLVRYPVEEAAYYIYETL